MKRNIFRKTMLIILCLICIIDCVTTISHASSDAAVEICVVFDNSASTYKDETWCQSQHAMEVFASMINYENGHKLRIYPLCDVAIGDYTTSDTEKVLRINGIEDVLLITNLQTIRPAGTSFSPVQAACEYLKSVSSAKDKRLIILTDGEFDGIPNGSKGLSDKLTSMIYNTDIKIHYIGYGTASPLKSNKQKGLYSFQATNTTELIDKLMDTYCSIFKQTLTTISDSDGFQLSTDSDKLIVVATGAEASVGSLHHEDGTSNIPNAKFSRFVRAKDYKRPSEYPKAFVDTTSEAHVAIFDDCVQGQYSIDYKNTKMFQIFCDSAVDIAPISIEGDNSNTAPISIEGDNSNTAHISTEGNNADTTPISTKDVNHPWMYIWIVILLAMLFICSMWLIIIQSHNKTKTHQQHIKERLSQTPNENTVFISYKSEEYEIALRTKQILEDNGVSCWMAPQSIPAGSDYGIEIPKAISNCKIFLLVLSEASQQSEWVPKELGTAISAKKYIIPFHIDQSSLREPFNFSLINNQRIEAYQRMSDAYKDLVDMVDLILSKDKTEA